jgi:hypothetical protein
VYAACTGSISVSGAVAFLSHEKVQSVPGMQLLIADTLQFADVDSARGLARGESAALCCVVRLLQSASRWYLLRTRTRAAEGRVVSGRGFLLACALFVLCALSWSVSRSLARTTSHRK